MVLRIVVIDELPLFCDGIAATIGNHSDWDVVDQGYSVVDAARMAGYGRADIVVVGLSRVDEALRGIKQLVSESVRVGIVCLVPVGAEAMVQGLLQAGVRGCITKRTTRAELTRCIEMVADGGSFVAPGLAVQLLCRSECRTAIKARPAPSELLNTRETEILELVAKGLSNRDIARTLVLSEKSIKRYMTFILQKLQVTSRLQAALCFQDVQESKSRAEALDAG